MGTANLLEAARTVRSVRAIVVITSDKCYESRDWRRGNREEDPMGGNDPYSASKGCAELVVASYRRSFFGGPLACAAVASVRAGNVIGGGDWAGRPDCAGCDSGDLRWQSLDRAQARGCSAMAACARSAGRLSDAGRAAVRRRGEGWAEAWNFGPDHGRWWTVAELVDKVFRRWGSGTWQAEPQENSFHEVRFLGLDSSKARARLGWQPRLSLDDAIALTVGWYRTALRGPGENLFEVACEHIRGYMKAPVTEPHAVLKSRR